MAENRTKLGKITFGVVSGALASCLLKLLLVMIETVTEALKPMDLPTDDVASGSLIIVAMIFATLAMFLLFALVIFLYWSAFKKNMPRRIRAVTVSLLVISILIFLVSAISFSTMARYQLEPGESGFPSTGDPVKLMISAALWSVMFSTLLIELRHMDTGRMKNAWIVVGIISLANFINSVSGSFSSGGNISPRSVISWIMLLCIFIGLTLISCWITNQDEFYEPHHGNACMYSAENAPPSGDGYADRLRELKQLLDEGLITEDDYNRKKSDILGLP